LDVGHELVLHLVFGHCVVIYSTLAFCPFEMMPQWSLFNDLGRVDCFTVRQPLAVSGRNSGGNEQRATQRATVTLHQNRCCKVLQHYKTLAASLIKV